MEGGGISNLQDRAIQIMQSEEDQERCLEKNLIEW